MPQCIDVFGRFCFFTIAHSNLHALKHFFSTSLLMFTGLLLFHNDKIPGFFHDISSVFHGFPGVIFFLFSMWPHTPFDPLISLVGRDSDLKSHEPWFSSFERNLARPPAHWLRSKEWNLPTALSSHI